MPGNSRPQVSYRNDTFQFAAVDDRNVTEFPRPHEIEGELGRNGRRDDIRIGGHDVTDGDGIRVQALGNYSPGDIAFRHDPDELAAFVNDHNRRNIVRIHVSRCIDRLVFRTQASKRLISDDIWNNFERHEMVISWAAVAWATRSSDRRVFHSNSIVQAIAQETEARQSDPQGHLFGDASISASHAVNRSRHRYRNRK